MAIHVKKKFVRENQLSLADLKAACSQQKSTKDLRGIDCANDLIFW